MATRVSEWVNRGDVDKEDNEESAWSVHKQGNLNRLWNITHEKLGKAAAVTIPLRLDWLTR